MRTLVVVRHAPTRKGRLPGATSSHLSPEGVRAARALGQELGEFAYVAVGDLPRHAETALALGHAFDEQVPWPSGYVPGVVEHHDQWDWERPFETYATLLRSHHALTEVAREHLEHWRRVVSGIPDGRQALIVSSGGSIEPPLVLAAPSGDHAAWGGAFHQLEGARLEWDEDRFRLSSLIRRDARRVG